MADKLDPTLVPPSKETIELVEKGLLVFYPDVYVAKDQALEVSKKTVYWRGIKKEGFDYILLTIFKRTDPDFAADWVRKWKEYYKKLETGQIQETEEYPAATIPERMDEILANYETSLEKEKVSAEQLERKNKELLLQVQKAIEKPTAPAASEGLKIAISPATAKGITSFATKTLFAPINFVMNAGKAQYYQESPTTMSAMELGLFSAIDPKEIRSAIKRKTGLNPETKDRLENLAKSMERAKNSSRLLNFLAAKAYGGRTVQFFFDIQEIGIPQARAYNLVASGNTFVLPQNYFSAKGILGGIGQQLFGKLASKGLKSLGKKVAKKAVTTAAAKGATVIAGTVVGGPIGAAISFVGSWILGKVKNFLSKLPRILTGERNKRLRWIAIASTFFGGIFLMQSGYPLAGSALAAAGGLAGAGQIAMDAKQLAPSGASFVQSIGIGLTSVALPAIRAPVIIAGISIPVLVAIILFIINSGAYIVPPRPPRFTGIVESPHIGVEKTATPDCLNRSGCPNLPNSITYNIKVTAKKGSLTNIKFENSYQVLGEGSDSSLPDVPSLDTPETISPMEPYVFSYTLFFGEELDDSIIIDTLKVTADAPENPEAMASDVASVIIGDPPASSCPILGGAISTGSYDGTAETGHGSNSYWGGPAGTDCFQIPAFSGCRSPSDAVDPDNNNFCDRTPQSCSHYGLAADVVGHRSDPVFLPSIFGETLDWQFERGPITIKKSVWGYGYIFKSGKYRIYLGHLNQTTPPSSAPSGTVIGTLYPLTYPHVHVELQIDGQWVRPDFLCGGTGP